MQPIQPLPRVYLQTPLADRLIARRSSQKNLKIFFISFDLVSQLDIFDIALVIVLEHGFDNIVKASVVTYYGNFEILFTEKVG
jgi:hypothetical protein